MKTILTAIIAALLVSATAHAASVTFPQEANFQTNVYLHDAPSTPLHTRVPTGNVLRATGGYIRPEQDVTLQGSFTLETNRNFTMVVRDMDTGIQSNGVVINANGTITLRKYLTGAGWSSVEINPTNRLPAPMLGGPYVSSDQQVNLNSYGTNHPLFSVGFTYVSGASISQQCFNVRIPLEADGMLFSFRPTLDFVTWSGVGTISTNKIRGGLNQDGGLVIEPNPITVAGVISTGRFSVAGGIVDGGAYTYQRTRIVTNIDYRTVVPPTNVSYGVELQDVGLTQRLIRAFGATTNDWRVIYSNP